jgi:serine/threonine protein kinase
MITSARKTYNSLNKNQQLLNINTIISANSANNQYNTNNQYSANNQYNSNEQGNLKTLIYENTSRSRSESSNGVNNDSSVALLLESQNTPEVLAHENNLNRINSIVNGNANSRMKYKILHFLGHGIHGNLYLAMDNANNRVICKEIILEDKHASDIARKQIEFELNILKYLTQNAVAREHINPCLDYTINNNTVYTIFPVFKGYSLGNFHQYLSRSGIDDYYRLLFVLVKSLLHALSKIHETGIAHQNINERSILVSTFINPRQIKVKFTDFGLGCGYLNKDNENSNVMPVDEYIRSQKELNSQNSGIANCRDNSNVPVTFTPEIFRQLRECDFLKVAQMYDVLCLGLIFIKYLLSFDSKLLNIDLTKPVDNVQLETIRAYLQDKYIVNGIQSLSKISMSINSKKLLLTYIKMIIKFMLCTTLKRRPAQYVLDKIIIFEKYKNDIF